MNKPDDSARASCRRIGASFIGEVRIGELVIWTGPRRSLPADAKADAQATLKKAA